MRSINLKKLGKELIPPILIPILKRYLSRTLSTYDKKTCLHPNELSEGNADLWNHPNWVNHVKMGLDRSIKNPESTNIHHKALIYSVNIANSISRKTINIVDIGGGVGIYYPIISNCLGGRNIDFMYYVVDSDENIKYGARILKSKNIVFHGQKDFDIIKLKISDGTTIVNLSAVLQYIIQWQSYLEYVIREIQPKIIVISRFPVSINAKVEGYCIQNITTPLGYAGSTRVVLFEPGSLDNFLRGHGYTKIQEVTCHYPNYFEKGCNDAQFKEISVGAHAFIYNNE